MGGIEEPVERQLEAYNARDIERFLAEYADGIQVFRPPAVSPVIVGKAAFREFFEKNRFNRPGLRARVVNRIIANNRVVDHERVTGIEAHEIEVIAIYDIADGRIRTVWFF